MEPSRSGKWRRLGWLILLPIALSAVVIGVLFWRNNPSDPVAAVTAASAAAILGSGVALLLLLLLPTVEDAAWKPRLVPGLAMAAGILIPGIVAAAQSAGTSIPHPRALGTFSTILLLGGIVASLRELRKRGTPG